MKKIAIFSLFFFLLGSVSLAVPHKINYQGVLKDSSGSPVTGNIDMTFAIYNGATGGTPTTALWFETHSGVTVEAGLYNVRLGSLKPIDPATFEGQTKYLGVTVGTDSEMEPRIPLISVPYAFRSEISDSVPDPIVPTDGKQDIVGELAVLNLGTGNGITGTTLSVTAGAYALGGLSSASADAVVGIAFGSGAGVKGISETGYGVYAAASGVSPNVNYGIYAATSSPNGYAGWFTGPGIGIYINNPGPNESILANSGARLTAGGA
jgi:hypothetical protein